MGNISKSKSSIENLIYEMGKLKNDMGIDSEEGKIIQETINAFNNDFLFRKHMVNAYLDLGSFYNETTK